MGNDQRVRIYNPYTARWEAATSEDDAVVREHFAQIGSMTSPVKPGAGLRGAASDAPAATPAPEDEDE